MPCSTILKRSLIDDMAGEDLNNSVAINVLSIVIVNISLATAYCLIHMEASTCSMTIYSLGHPLNS